MRYSSIDILRTLAIVVMVFVHFGENLSGYSLPIAGFGAPVFIFVSGISYRLWLNGQIARKKSDEQISKVSIRRGLFVFCVGIAFNILVWLPEDTFNWDVLTLIGSALLMLNLFRRVPLPVTLNAAALIIAVSPVFRAAANYESYWQNRYFELDLTLSDVLIGYFGTGYFPLFPWVGYSLIGFVVGTRLFPEIIPDLEDAPTPASALKTAILPGIGLMLTSVVLLLAGPSLPEIVATYFVGGWTMFPPTTTYVTGTLGMALFLFGMLHIFIDRNESLSEDSALMWVTKEFSRHSFTIYILHHLIHLWPMWIYSVAAGNEPTALWGKVSGLEISMCLSVLFLACCVLWFRIITPTFRPGMEASMRWLCD